MLYQIPLYQFPLYHNPSCRNFFYFDSSTSSPCWHTLWLTFTDVVGRLHVSSPLQVGQTDNKGGVFPVWAGAGASGIGIAYWWPLLSPNHCLHNAHWKPSHHYDPRDVSVCVSQTQPPDPPFFSKFWLVHVANVQVDYADKGRKGHMILAMSSCVVDFAQRATGPFIAIGKEVWWFSSMIASFEK